jgi:DNA gyrase inhibitor GyrI/AraC-like DNA-binding protein
LYTEKVNRAADYIKNNLDKKITLSEISSAAEVPPDHINQFFLAFTGESIYEALIRMRIERAALELSNNPKMKIKDAAETAGCKESSEFSSLFKGRFSVSPSAWRKGETKFHYPPLKKKPDSVSSPEALSTVVKTLQGFSVAFIKHTGIYAGDTSLFIYLYNKLTSWAASQGLLEPEYENIVVYQEPPEISADRRSRISLGITVPDATETGGDIGKIKIPGGSYLICRYNLHENEYTAAWMEVFNRWLPEHNAFPAGGCRFEQYPADVNNNDKYSSIADLCIPVKSNN